MQPRPPTLRGDSRRWAVRRIGFIDETNLTVDHAVSRLEFARDGQRRRVRECFDR